MRGYPPDLPFHVPHISLLCPSPWGITYAVADIWRLSGSAGSETKNRGRQKARPIVFQLAPPGESPFVVCPLSCFHPVIQESTLLKTGWEGAALLESHLSASHPPVCNQSFRRPAFPTGSKGHLRVMTRSPTRMLQTTAGMPHSTSKHRPFKSS